ncbi:phospholipase A2 inhibitor and Ly6/PLAUR domain-containing protein-like [Spea bombifrons]|uniref:phospholipase A2 inhibitor and Ly6/PLAUR domain-containing protein-like n=1 Tax=Spea bombifrons TaxID=233779 RepID=UPI00234BBA7C|nr:phospholipase A2 inhibitor and Ly6/PLAUR domain-containing protein-like [Spea bombifrons]
MADVPAFENVVVNQKPKRLELKSTVHGIICQECFNNESISCEGPIATCASCQTIITDQMNSNGSQSIIEKSCNLFPNFCNISYSVTAGDVHMGFISSCCDTDFCSNTTTEVPPQNTTENGVVCPVCFLENAEECVADETIRCTGAETKCINFAGKVYAQGTCNMYALQGCVTQNVCDISNIPLYPQSQLCAYHHLQCSDGNSTTNHH